MEFTELSNRQGLRHFRLAGEQSGDVLLHELHHGIEYKSSVLHTKARVLRQDTLFEPSLRLVVNLAGATHLDIDKTVFSLYAGGNQAGMLLPVNETVAGSKLFYEGSQNELVWFFSSGWLAEWCCGHSALRRLLWHAHLKPYYFPLTPAVMRQIMLVRESNGLLPVWRRLRQEAHSVALLAEVLQLLFPDIENERVASLSDKRLSRLLALLHDGRYDKLTLAELAKLCYSNPTTLQNEFQAVYGQNIDQYRRMRRLHLAYSVLKEGGGVSDAAQTAGYANMQSFARAFRKQFGCSPSVFR